MGFSNQLKSTKRVIPLSFKMTYNIMLLSSKINEYAKRSLSNDEAFFQGILRIKAETVSACK